MDHTQVTLRLAKSNWTQYWHIHIALVFTLNANNKITVIQHERLLKCHHLLHIVSYKNGDGEKQREVEGSPYLPLCHDTVPVGSMTHVPLLLTCSIVKGQIQPSSMFQRENRLTSVKAVKCINRVEILHQLPFFNPSSWRPQPCVWLMPQGTWDTLQCFVLHNTKLCA